MLGKAEWKSRALTQGNADLMALSYLCRAPAKKASLGHFQEGKCLVPGVWVGVRDGKKSL